MPSAAPSALPLPGAICAVLHPSWGRMRARVLRVDGRPGYVLVQDLSPNGAREWVRVEWMGS